MGVGTGLIFGAIVAAWLVYLVPWILNRKGQALSAELDPEEAFANATVAIVKPGTSLAVAEAGEAAASTPLSRRAALAELKQLDERAAARRRRVLAVLGIVLLLVVGLVAIKNVPWWALAFPVGLMGAFGAVARRSVRAMRRDLDERAARIRSGEDEQTVGIKVMDAVSSDTGELSVSLSEPITTPGSLWDPIPVTPPTYVSSPLAPRTVRTIDLSAPGQPKAAAVPVTADPLVAPAAPQEPDERPGLRAVGE